MLHEGRPCVLLTTVSQIFSSGWSQFNEWHGRHYVNCFISRVTSPFWAFPKKEKCLRRLNFPPIWRQSKTWLQEKRKEGARKISSSWQLTFDLLPGQTPRAHCLWTAKSTNDRLPPTGYCYNQVTTSHANTFGGTRARRSFQYKFLGLKIAWEEWLKLDFSN